MSDVGPTRKWRRMRMESVHPLTTDIDPSVELAEHLGRETESGRIVILHKIRQSDIAAMAGVARENGARRERHGVSKHDD